MDPTDRVAPTPNGSLNSAAIEVDAASARRRFLRRGAVAAAGLVVLDRMANTASANVPPVSSTVIIVDDYASLRSYNGTQAYFFVTGVSGTMEPEIYGEFCIDATDTTSADNGGTIIVLANGKRAKRRFEGDVNVEWFGAVGNGESGSPTNCDAAFSAALAYCHATGRALRLPRRSYKLTQGLTVDLSQTTIHGEGARLIFTSLTSGRALSVVSGEGYPASSVTHVWLGGFALVGSLNQQSTTGFYVGHPTYTFGRQFEFREVSVFRFGKNYEFGPNTYRIRFSHCTASEANQYQVYSPVGLPNSGEANAFDNCLFENGGSIYVGDGQWAFRSCSFLHCPFRAGGEAHVTIFGGNIESPGGAAGGGYRYVSVEDTAWVDLKGPTIVIVAPQGGLLVQSPMVNNSANGGGLMLDGCIVPQDGFMRPETNDAVRTFVAGNGRTIVNGVHMFESFGVRDHFPIARSCNVIGNADAESANTNGWSTLTSGAGGTFTNVTGGKNGARAFRVSGNSSGGIKAYQEFPTIPGRIVTAGLWAKVLSWAGYVALEYYTQQGLLIARVQENVVNASPPNGTTVGAWTWVGGLASSVSPPGATKCRFLVEATGDNVIVFDDVIVNVA